MNRMMKAFWFLFAAALFAIVLEGPPAGVTQGWESYHQSLTDQSHSAAIRQMVVAALTSIPKRIVDVAIRILELPNNVLPSNIYDFVPPVGYLNHNYNMTSPERFRRFVGDIILVGLFVWLFVPVRKQPSIKSEKG